MSRSTFSVLFYANFKSFPGSLSTERYCYMLCAILFPPCWMIALLKQSLQVTLILFKPELCGIITLFIIIAVR